MLDDMSGAYTSLTLSGWQVDERLSSPKVTNQQPEGLEYLHAAPSWTFGARGVYSLANALDLPLNQFPLVMVSMDPWVDEEILVVSLRDLLNQPIVDRNEQLADFFAALLTACRTAKGTGSHKRLRLLKKELEPHLQRGRGGTLKSVAESGILAQVIEGILKGLGLSS